MKFKFGRNENYENKDTMDVVSEMMGTMFGHLSRPSWFGQTSCSWRENQPEILRALSKLEEIILQAAGRAGSDSDPYAIHEEFSCRS